MEPNPFYNVGAITDERFFHGRADLLQTLADASFSASPQCVALIGQRKIGKTSLALHLARQTQLAKPAISSPFIERTAFLYFNCQTNYRDVSNYSTFFASLLSEVRALLKSTFGRECAALNVDVSSEHPEKEWGRVLGYLSSVGLNLVTIFDEFDKAIAQESLLRDGFFGILRGTAQERGNFAWITCTYRPLPELFQQAFDEFKLPAMLRKSESDFAGIVIPYVVGLFTEDEVSALVNDLMAQSPYSFAGEDLASIAKFGGRFPFFLQRACFHHHNWLSGKRYSREETVRQIRFECYQHWDGYWAKLGEALQQTLLSATVEPSKQLEERHAETLIELSLVRRVGHLLEPLSAEFGDFVLRKRRATGFGTLRPSSLTAGRYDVRREIVSEYSQLLKAYDTKLRRNVAIKYLREEVLEGPFSDDLKSRLKREAMILAKLHHPNVGAVYDVLDHPIGIVMEWVDGASLQEVIENRTELSHDEIYAIARDLSDALIHIHTNGVIHRDIKPSNIILTAERMPKLIDFGVARYLGHQTITLDSEGRSFSVGTPRYFAPEQFSERPNITEKTDVFALATVIYELFTHKLPFRFGGDPLNYENATIPVPDMRSLPSGIADVLCVALSQQQELRPTAEVFRRLLVNG